MFCIFNNRLGSHVLTVELGAADTYANSRVLACFLCRVQFLSLKSQFLAKNHRAYHISVAAPPQIDHHYNEP